ncbi:hypothetical protein niasHS_004621 [Heterodera schachtii]|uniref:FLYWCH-type domain-containing protein n=1 Tax=Heterodera schachtii TaxID=97005 RepID=A0ABD2JR01_HETSC
MATFVASQKGGTKLEFEGHLYQKKEARGDNIYWRCDQYKNLGMESRYVENEEYRIMVKMFSALSFCPAENIIDNFNSLAVEFINFAGDGQAHLDFLNYFEATWIGRPGRRPLFPLEMWNNRTVTLQQLPRTTNSVESWHHQIQSKFSSPHPNIFTFIDGIRSENVRVNAICVKLDCGHEVPLYSRLEYRQANERLLNLIRGYQQADQVNFLRATSRFIKFRGVDPVQQEAEDMDED